MLLGEILDIHSLKALKTKSQYYGLYWVWIASWFVGALRFKCLFWCCTYLSLSFSNRSVCAQRQSFTVLCSDRACSERRRSVCLFSCKYVIDITWLILHIFSLPLHHHTGENGESYQIPLSSVEREKPENSICSSGAGREVA